MNSLQMESLRDFAIEHLPRAQKIREQAKKFGGVNDGLSHVAVMALGSPTSTAIERAAAALLEPVVLYLIGNTTADVIAWAVNSANDLCMLTGRVIPWLDAAISEPPLPPPMTTPVVLEDSGLKPGTNCTTAEAAKALMMKSQTLFGWSSNETGPIRPIRIGKRRIVWSSNEVIALINRKK
jgi:predicted DNA-binding transcriptional regulator AlpA